MGNCAQLFGKLESVIAYFKTDNKLQYLSFTLFLNLLEYLF